MGACTGSETWNRVETQFDARRLGLLMMKGKTKSIDVFELLGEKGALPSNVQEVVGLFQEGLELYYEREWTKALYLFRKSSSVGDKEDRPSEHYIRECGRLINSPPDWDWDGAIKLQV